MIYEIQSADGLTDGQPAAVQLFIYLQEHSQHYRLGNVTK